MTSFDPKIHSATNTSEIAPPTLDTKGQFKLERNFAQRIVDAFVNALKWLGFLKPKYESLENRASTSMSDNVRRKSTQIAHSPCVAAIATLSPESVHFHRDRRARMDAVAEAGGIDKVRPSRGGLLADLHSATSSLRFHLFINSGHNEKTLPAALLEYYNSVRSHLNNFKNTADKGVIDKFNELNQSLVTIEDFIEELQGLEHDPKRREQYINKAINDLDNFMRYLNTI